MSTQTPLKVAILGCGDMAAHHMKRLAARSDTEPVALCDVSEEIVQKFIDKNLAESDAPAPPIFTDAAQMYAQTKPDAVCIVTPHTLHFEQGKQAIEAGCHVFMEKPMVTDSKQAHELADIVKDSGKVFVVGYNSSCSPQYYQIREWIRSNEFGKLQTITMWLTQNWKRANEGTWRQKPELSGGGHLYDTGAHIINSLLWSIERPVAEVQAFLDNCGAPVEINGAINIRFADGTLAAVTLAGQCPTFYSHACYSFDNGRIEVNPFNGRNLRAWKGKEEIEINLENEKQSPINNFLDAVLGRAEPRTSPLNGIIHSELMEAIYKSAETGQVVKMN